MLYVGTKDDTVYVAEADGVNAAYLAIGRAFDPPYTGDDPGNVSLDTFAAVPPIAPGTAVALPND